LSVLSLLVTICETSSFSLESTSLTTSIAISFVFSET
jgi:hypothetical protein